MSNQVLATLIGTGLVLLLPSVVGALITWRGTEHSLWGAAATALALAVCGWLSLAAGPAPGGIGNLSAVLFGYLLSLGGLVTGIATCAAALLQALRARQFAWSAALLLVGAVPLVTTIVVFDVTVALSTPHVGGEPLGYPGVLLAAQLLPIGLVILLAYGGGVARGAQKHGSTADTRR
jgi:hypothetical protein